MSDSWHQTRVLTAAQFIGRCLVVRTMTIRRGESTLLEIRVSPKREDDSHVREWRYGRPWGYPAIPPIWPLKAVDPWERASFISPLLSKASGDARQPCHSCGSVPSGQANYCSECGAAFDSPETYLATRLARIVGEFGVGAASAGEGLIGVIEDYTPKSSRVKKGWPELLQFIREDFAGLATADFLSGEPAVVGPGLTLASAQDIHQVVVSTGRVHTEQVQQAELILRYAPLQPGYWGSFKALVKAVPVDDMPDAYADALARLSSFDWSRPAPPTVHIEDVGLLRGFLDSASVKTRTYLARRARRDLASLAQRDPDLYARVAARMIIRWDQNLAHHSFPPAYVMLGAHSPLDRHSKRVVKRPDMSSRRDAHPEIWNAQPDLVRNIFDTVKNSVEAQTWCFQVLESLGQAPQVAGEQLKLALLSSFAPLSLAANAALSARPGMWDSLTAEHWAAIFRSGGHSNVDGILDALSIGTARPAAVEAARDFLKSRASVSPRRLLRISVIFLSGSQPIPYLSLRTHTDAYISAAAALINQSAARYKKLWFPVVKALNLDGVERLRQRLADNASTSAVKEVDSKLIRLRFIEATPSEAIDWIASENAEEVKLGWILVDESYGISGLLQRIPKWISMRLPDPAAVERVLIELFPRVTQAEAPQLAAIIEKALGRGVESRHLIAPLIKTSIGTSAVWELASGEAVTGFLDVRPDYVKVLGDSLHIDQLASASPGQLRFVLRYIKENPGRISDDVSFGIAAATSNLSTLQTEAIKQLRESGQMASAWLPLAQSEIPHAVAAGRDYLTALADGHDVADAVRECLDSGVVSVRGIGVEALTERLNSTEEGSQWTAIAECTDHRVEEILASRPELVTYVDDHVLANFDRRVLVSDRLGRRAKDFIKARLDVTAADAGLAASDRVAALMELARGQKIGDKEWALVKLAQLALAGVTIDGLGVSLTTTSERA